MFADDDASPAPVWYASGGSDLSALCELTQPATDCCGRKVTGESEYPESDVSVSIGVVGVRSRVEVESFVPVDSDIESPHACSRDSVRSERSPEGTSSDIVGCLFWDEDDDVGDGGASPDTYAPGIGKMSGVLPLRRRS